MKKWGRAVGAAVAFVGISLLVCALCTGTFLLGGGMPGQEKPDAGQDTRPLPQPPRGTVILDAGHGGEDGGAIGVTGLVEKDLNLDLALRLAALLEARGYRVIMTRTEDVLLYDRNVDYQGRKKQLDLAARQAIGDAYPDAVFVSLHANTFSQPIYHGLQVWYSPNHASSAALAERIRTAVTDTLQPDNHRQSKVAGSNIYLLYHLRTPAVLVECGFLSNPAEASRLSEEGYRRALAAAIFAAIAPYVGTSPAA